MGVSSLPVVVLHHYLSKINECFYMVTNFCANLKIGIHHLHSLQWLCVPQRNGYRNADGRVADDRSTSGKK